MQRILTADFADGAHLMYVNGTFWRYGRYWSQTSDEAIQQSAIEVIRMGGGPKGLRPNAASREAVALLKAQMLREDDPLRFEAQPLPVINCRNGELWFDDKGEVRLKPHSPASGLRHCLEVDYDQAATCPRYDNALLDIFGQSGDAVAMASFWDELCGYVIQPDRRHALVVILWGSGGNGKTSLTDTMIRLLGTSLVYAGKVERLSENRFAFGNLFGKLLFVDDDVPPGIKLPDGELKTISEAKLLTGEQKFKNPFNFVCRTVPFLLCNSVPSLADLSFGMQRRLVVVPFDKTINESNINRDLFPEIWDNELPGVLNRALSGYQRLFQRRRLEKPMPVAQATQKWLRQANPVALFVDECCGKEAIGRTLFTTAYNAYTDWTKVAGITRPQQRISFRRNLEFLGFEIKHTNRGNVVLGLTLQVAVNSTVRRPTPAVVNPRRFSDR